MVASVFPLAMGRDAAQVCVPLPRPRALRSDTALGWCTSGEITRRWQSKAGQASRPSKQADKQAGRQASRQASRLTSARRALEDRAGRQAGRQAYRGEQA